MMHCVFHSVSCKVIYSALILAKISTSLKRVYSCRSRIVSVAYDGTRIVADLVSNFYANSSEAGENDSITGLERDGDQYAIPIRRTRAHGDDERFRNRSSARGRRQK